MHKRAKILLLFVGLSLLFSFFVTFAFAAPAPPANVVNHKTHECAIISGGDECISCVPTGDWEILIGDCPEGYTILDGLAPSSCSYSGDTISMCDYAKNKPLPQLKVPAISPNTRNFIIVLVIIVLLSVVIYYVDKRGASD
jgi:hypothetical protein